MNGTRTARTVLFGLVGLMAGLFLPIDGAARSAAATPTPVMRGSGADVRGADDLSRAAATFRLAESEGRAVQLPPVGVVPSKTDFRTPVLIMVLMLVGSAVAVAPRRTTVARAPPSPLCL